MPHDAARIDDVAALPLADTDRQAALRVAAQPPVDPLVIIVGRGAGLLAATLAHVWAPQVADRLVLGPEQGRWSTQEVASVRAAAGRTPQQRHAIVLRDGGSLTARHFDQLLKTFEEPPAPCWFLLCLDELASAPAAIRGRAAVVLEARPAEPAARARALVEAGLQPQQAQDVVAACAGRVELEVAVARRPELLEPLNELAAMRAQGPQPVTRAAQAMVQVDQLAGELTEDLGSKAAAQRAVVSLLLDRWTAAARGALAADVPAASEPALVATVVDFLAAVDRARVALERNVAPAAVLAAVTSAG